MYYDPGINCVVVNYRTPLDLDGFCQSFYDNLPEVPCNLTIANVAPLERDREVAESWRERYQATLLTFEDNVGYAHACNHGMTHGNCEVGALFNSDIVLMPTTLQRCYEMLITDCSVGIVGPLQYDQQGRITHAGIVGSNDKPVHVDWHLPVGPQHRVNRSVVTVSGSAYFIKREAWDQLTACPLYQDCFPQVLGAFMPSALYYEETACSYHARAHGWTIRMVGAEAECIHKWHQSIVENNVHNYANKCFEESKTMFRKFCAHHGIECD